MPCEYGLNTGVERRRSRCDAHTGLAWPGLALAWLGFIQFDLVFIMPT